MANRFYQVNLLSGPTYWEDIGNNLSIVGILLEGESTPTILKLPSCGSSSDKIRRSTIIDMDYEEWSQFLQHSDQPSVLLKDESGTVKAIHRKTRYDVSGAIQQKIWARDGLPACSVNREWVKYN